MITIYSTSTCGYCHRLKTQLDRENIPYADVNIEQDPQGALFVESANDGNQTVPTVRFPDGTAMANPTLTQVKTRLAAASK